MINLNQHGRQQFSPNRASTSKQPNTSTADTPIPTTQTAEETQQTEIKIPSQLDADFPPTNTPTPSTNLASADAIIEKPKKH